MGEGRADSAAKWAQLGGAVGGVAGMVYGWVVSTEVKTAKHALEAFTWGGGGALCGAAVVALLHFAEFGSFRRKLHGFLPRNQAVAWGRR